MRSGGEQLWTRTRDGIALAVRLTPKSSGNEVAGPGAHDGRAVLKARVRAVPEKGKANAALEKLIAKWLGRPASSVSLASGGKSRLKSVAVKGDADVLATLVEARLAELS